MFLLFLMLVEKFDFLSNFLLQMLMFAFSCILFFHSSLLLMSYIREMSEKERKKEKKVLIIAYCFTSVKRKMCVLSVEEKL